KSFAFNSAQSQVQGAACAIETYGCGKGQTDVAEAEFGRYKPGDGENRVFVLPDGPNDSGERGGDAVVGRAFGLLDGVAGGTGFVRDREEERFVIGQALVVAKVFERHSSDARGRESRDLCIAVFADDVGVNIFWGDAEMLCEAATEARRVQRRS